MPTALAFHLIQQCAPQVAPETMLAVASAESGLDPLAIHVNGSRQQYRLSDWRDAVSVARRHVAAGDNVDLGIAQLNSRNLGWLGLTIGQAFQPCANLRGAAHLLSDSYHNAIRRYPSATALAVALSRYNSGSDDRGFRNGYIRRVYAAAQRTPVSAAPVRHALAPPGNRRTGDEAAVDIFAASRGGSQVIFGGSQ